jgi:hypothetical protein
MSEALAFATLRAGPPTTVDLPRLPGEARAVAGWRRGDLGVVLVVRRWRNGALAYDVVPCLLDDGEWTTSAYGGANLDDRAARRDTVEWFAEYETTIERRRGSQPLHMLVGMAGADVHSLRVRHAGHQPDDQSVHHPPGLVVVGATRPAEVVALDVRGRSLGTWAV